MEESKAVKVGPWGGPGGSIWITDMKDVVGINMITIRYGWAIDSLIFTTVDINGNCSWSARIGGEGGDTTDKVIFDYPREVLTSIEGRYGKFCDDSPVVVTMLTFKTNRSATYGPYGKESGTSFLVPVTDGKIVGFFGHADRYMDSIGVCLKHIDSDNYVPCHQLSDLDISTHIIDPPIENSPVGSLIPRWPSLYGGVGGRPWDDGAFQGVKGIVICRNEDVIFSMSVEYDRNGKSFFSTVHGGSSGKIQNKIKFEDYPEEYLVGFQGFYGPFDGSSGPEVIKSLTFYTNKGKYGPLGEEVGKFFSSTGGGKVVGFLGRSGRFLDALGLHMEYNLSV